MKSSATDGGLMVQGSKSPGKKKWHADSKSSATVEVEAVVLLVVLLLPVRRPTSQQRPRY